MKRLEVFAVVDVVVSDSDRSAFFQVFDFGPVAVPGFGGCQGAHGALAEPAIAQLPRSNDRYDGEFAGESTFEGFVFRPRVQAVGNDAFLAGVRQVADLLYDPVDDEIFAFAGTQLFAKRFFVFLGMFEPGLGHGVEYDATEIDPGKSLFGQVLDSRAFAAAS